MLFPPDFEKVPSTRYEYFFLEEKHSSVVFLLVPYAHDPNRKGKYHKKRNKHGKNVDNKETDAKICTRDKKTPMKKRFDLTENVWR